MLKHGIVPFSIGGFDLLVARKEVPLQALFMLRFPPLFAEEVLPRFHTYRWVQCSARTLYCDNPCRSCTALVRMQHTSRSCFLLEVTSIEAQTDESHPVSLFTISYVSYCLCNCKWYEGVTIFFRENPKSSLVNPSNHF